MVPPFSPVQAVPYWAYPPVVPLQGIPSRGSRPLGPLQEFPYKWSPPVSPLWVISSIWSPPGNPPLGNLQGSLPGIPYTGLLHGVLYLLPSRVFTSSVPLEGVLSGGPSMCSTAERALYAGPSMASPQLEILEGFFRHSRSGGSVQGCPLRGVRPVYPLLQAEVRDCCTQ
jgi:hypothetical protein